MINSNFLPFSFPGNHRIRVIVLASGATSLLAGFEGFCVNVQDYISPNCFGSPPLFNSPLGVAVEPGGQRVVVADTLNNYIRIVTIPRDLTQTGTEDTQLRVPIPLQSDGVSSQQAAGLALTPDGRFAIVVLVETHVVVQVNLNTREVIPLAGSTGNTGHEDGIGNESSFAFPAGVSVSPDGKWAAIAE
jgi:DNA-binding beta-propeller fold protein YncE